MNMKLNHPANKINWEAIVSEILATHSSNVNWDFWLACYPALEKAKQTPQDPIYHAEGNVWIHTKMVVICLLDSSNYIQCSEEEKICLFLAALLHDIAKADTTTIDPLTGRIGHPHHSTRGAIDVRNYLWFQHAPFAIRECICGLIEHHQKPFHLMKKDNIEFHLHKLSWEIPLHLLLILAKADLFGRITTNQEKSFIDIEMLWLLAEEGGFLTQEKTAFNSISRCEYARHQKGHCDFEFYKTLGSKVYVLSGLPASGKNYWIKKNYPGLPTVSFDDARDELKLKHGQNHGLVAHKAIDKAKALLRTKEPFIWNATHTSRKLREKTLNLLFDYHADVHIIYFEQSPKTLFLRNQERQQMVPISAIENMLKRWDCVKKWEGYNVTYKVND
ncbi:AAA family ATPase [Thorsellia anophelis]|uniref:Predicted kinase n=1 Tax=Thorsellia anophelis DSM 18579 TaxID=1123402 RepID=A0A1I0FBJ6_9GAMM|nr:AAA family ATPase [Thorsellia anophelis]SET54551.1 Predicted kinase [Thorsellia anophelis DSM 18579]